LPRAITALRKRGSWSGGTARHQSPIAVIAFDAFLHRLAWIYGAWGGASMKNRLAAAFVVVAAASGCAEQATAEWQETGRITVGGTTHTTQTVSCEQYEWSLIILTIAGPGHARAFLQLGGEQPTVRTVSRANFDGFNGVAGEGGGNADASFADGTYRISGTAEGSEAGNPSETRTLPFRIEAPC
jgi:lipoprotein LpqH